MICLPGGGFFVFWFRLVSGVCVCVWATFIKSNFLARRHTFSLLPFSFSLLVSLGTIYRRAIVFVGILVRLADWTELAGWLLECKWTIKKLATILLSTFHTCFHFLGIESIKVKVKEYDWIEKLFGAGTADNCSPFILGKADCFSPCHQFKVKSF